MKKINMKMMIVLIIAFFVVVGLLAAITALAGKEKKPKEATTPTPSSTPVVVENKIPENVANNTNTTYEPTKLTGFDKYDNSLDLELFFDSHEVESVTAYSVAGMNMIDIKDDIDFDLIYSKEVKSSELKDLEKEFKKSFVEDNLLDPDTINEDALYASQLIVVNEEFYFGLNEDYAFIYNGMDINVFEISDNLKKFAREMPEEVDTDFTLFSLKLGDDMEIGFDEGEVNQIKENFYSYKVDLDTDDFEYYGQIEFDNGNKLDVYEGDKYHIGVYKSGKDETTVMLNKDSIDVLIDMVNGALGN